MMYQIKCPHCGGELNIDVTKAGDIILRSYCIYDDSEQYEFIKSMGYEFGITPEGGERNGQVDHVLKQG